MWTISRRYVVGAVVERGDSITASTRSSSSSGGTYIITSISISINISVHTLQAHCQLKHNRKQRQVSTALHLDTLAALPTT